MARRVVLRLACALFHPRGVHLGGYFLPQNTQKRPSGDTEEAGKEGASHDPASFYHAEALAKPSRLRSRQASPSVNR